jgi:hypothetical protein
MALPERVQVSLAHLPLQAWAGIELPGAIHRQPSRLVLHDQPLDRIDVRLVGAEVIGIASEHRLHIRLIAFQDERSGADGGLDPLEVAIFLCHFRGDDPHGGGAGQDVEQPHEGFFEDELHRVAIHDLDPVDRVEEVPARIRFFRQKAVEGEFHVLGDQFAPVDGRFVVPSHPPAQMEHVGGVVRLFPAFGQVGLDDEGPRPHVSADFVAQEPATQEAQDAMRPAIAGQMGIEVHGIPSAHAEDPAVLGRLRCFAPEDGRTIGGPDREGCAGGQAGFQQITAAQIMDMTGPDVVWLHDPPSFSPHPVRFVAYPARSQETLTAASAAPLPTAPTRGTG